MIEALDPVTHSFTRSLFATWQRIGEDALKKLGIAPDAAALEARLLVDNFYGIQYDFVLNNDAETATTAFREAMRRHRERIDALLL